MDDLYCYRLAPGEYLLIIKASRIAEDVNWLVPAPARPVRTRAQIRYRSPAAPAEIVPGASRTVSVRFDELQRAIAPGQSVVFYDGDRMIGGGTIRGASRR